MSRITPRERAELKRHVLACDQARTDAFVFLLGLRGADVEGEMRRIVNAADPAVQKFWNGKCGCADGSYGH